MKNTPSTIYQNEFNLKSKVNETNEIINSRGLTIPKTKNKKTNNKNYLWYWEKYNFTLLPSINLLNVTNYLSKLKKIDSNSFLGIAVDNIPPELQNKKIIRNQNLLKKIPLAKDEIINNSKI